MSVCVFAKNVKVHHVCETNDVCDLQNDFLVGAKISLGSSFVRNMSSVIAKLVVNTALIVFHGLHSRFTWFSQCSSQQHLSP